MFWSGDIVNFESSKEIEYARALKLVTLRTRYQNPHDISFVFHFFCDYISYCAKNQKLIKNQNKLKNTLKAFDDYKNKRQKCMK